MISVVFKNGYNNSFGGKEYTYKDYENAEVGDIVAVNTCNGLGVAQVTRINIFSFEIDEDKLKTVEKIIKSAKEQAEEVKTKYEKEMQMRAFVKTARKVTLLNELRAVGGATQYAFLDSLTLEELEVLYKKIKG